MKASIAAVLITLLAACSAEVSPLPVAQPTSHIQVVEPTIVPTSPIPEEPAAAERWNFLVLGIDKAYWRDDDPKRAHTDFMMVVSIRENQVTLIQIPRNTYVPVPNIPADFAFGQYSNGGIPLVEEWTEAALGLSINGTAIARMDDFIAFVDSIGGVIIAGKHYDGLELLSFVRFELFGDGHYDSEGKHFLAGEALWEQFRRKASNPVAMWNLMVQSSRFLYENSDHVRINPVEFLSGPLLPLVQGRYSVERVRLEDALCYEDIPFENPGTTKGLLVCEGVDLHQWVQEKLD